MNINLSLKIAAIFLLNFLLFQSAKAQVVKPAKADSVKINRAQNVFVELGGPGLFFSGNYDTRFSKRRDGLGGRIGFGYLDDSGTSFSAVPVQFNYLLGKQGKYFEIGIGATFVYYNGDSNQSSDIIYFDRVNGGSSATVGTMTFGYRYQPEDSGFSFRASFNPLFNSSNFYPYVGVSFGYTIK